MVHTLGSQLVIQLSSELVVGIDGVVFLVGVNGGRGVVGVDRCAVGVEVVVGDVGFIGRVVHDSLIVVLDGDGGSFGVELREVVGGCDFDLEGLIRFNRGVFFGGDGDFFAFNASTKADGLVFDLGVVRAAVGGAIDGVDAEVDRSRCIAFACDQDLSCIAFPDVGAIDGEDRLSRR